MLSDNGASSTSATDLAQWLDQPENWNTSAAPLANPGQDFSAGAGHNRILLEHYYLPGDLERQVAAFVARSRPHARYRRPSTILPQLDVYFGRAEAVLLERERIKRRRSQTVTSSATSCRNISIADHPEPPFCRPPIFAQSSDDGQLNEISNGRTVGVLATGSRGARESDYLLRRSSNRGSQSLQFEGIRLAPALITTRSTFSATGLERRECPLFIAADGQRVAELAGDQGNGMFYGGTMESSVLARRIAAGRKRADQNLRLRPAVSLATTVGSVLQDMGTLVVAMANRAFRGDLFERGVPEVLQSTFTPCGGVRLCLSRRFYSTAKYRGRFSGIGRICNRAFCHLG